MLLKESNNNKKYFQKRYFAFGSDSLKCRRAIKTHEKMGCWVSQDAGSTPGGSPIFAGVCASIFRFNVQSVQLLHSIFIEICKGDRVYYVS